LRSLQQRTRSLASHGWHRFLQGSPYPPSFCLRMLHHISTCRVHTFFKFSTPMGWFYFLLHITIKIINCNSTTSDVGGCLLPRQSE
jgi:hypothetical protein